jgi:hypothetical protein
MLFIRTSGSESCSSERVAALAVHQTEWQHKLFIRTSGSISCSSGLRKQQGLFNGSTAAAASSKGCFAAETSRPAIRDFNRSSLAPNPQRGFVSLKLGSG